MTKKYWADWQKRVGETQNIHLFYRLNKPGKHVAYSGVINELNCDRLVNATFHGDIVDLVIERHSMVFNESAWGFHTHIENEYLTLHREEIANVKFVKV